MLSHKSTILESFYERLEPPFLVGALLHDLPLFIQGVNLIHKLPEVHFYHFYRS